MTTDNGLRSESHPGASTRQRSRFSLPRFGLRSVFVCAAIFCLIFGWVGRNLYRVRQEEAAIEALKEAYADIFVTADDGLARHPATPGRYLNYPGVTREKEDWYGQLLGYSGRLKIEWVTLGREERDLDEEKAQAALEALAIFPELKRVGLEGEVFGNDSLPALTKLPALEWVGLEATRVDGDGLAKLRDCRQLREVHLASWRSPELVSGFASLSKLTGVFLYDGPISRADLESIVAIPQLTALSLESLHPQTDDAFAPLSKASTLRSLTIRRNPFDRNSYQFGDNDVATVANLDRLESLMIEGLTDQGVAELGTLSALRWLHLGEPATREGAVAFSAAHPKCLVHFYPTENEQWCRAGEAIEPPPPEQSYWLPND